MRRTARHLHDKALSSLRRAVDTFNALDDDGRVTAILLHLQHAFEMLLKAGLEQRGVRLFDKNSGISEGMKKCINLATEYLELSEEDAGLIRAIDALRDEEQHWFAEIDEGLLYTHTVAGVSLFGELLEQAFDGADLHDHLPKRVLPISTEPPQSIQFFIDRQFETIQRLLEPGSRKRAHARAHVRTLLALEAHSDEDADVSEKDVRRAVQAIRDGKSRAEVFPRLAELSTLAEGEGIELRVRMVRNDGDAIPVRYTDDGENAAAIRERDLQKRYKWSLSDLYKRFRVGNQKGKALGLRAGIDDDPKYVHVFTFGKTKHPRYSDEALKQMERTLDEVGIETIWSEYKAEHRSNG